MVVIRPSLDFEKGVVASSGRFEAMESYWRWTQSLSKDTSLGMCTMHTYVQELQVDADRCVAVGGWTSDVDADGSDTQVPYTKVRTHTTTHLPVLIYSLVSHWGHGHEEPVNGALYM